MIASCEHSPLSFRQLADTKAYFLFKDVLIPSLHLSLRGRAGSWEGRVLGGEARGAASTQPCGQACWEDTGGVIRAPGMGWMSGNEQHWCELITSPCISARAGGHTG